MTQAMQRLSATFSLASAPMTLVTSSSFMPNDDAMPSAMAVFVKAFAAVFTRIELECLQSREASSCGSNKLSS